MPQALTLVVLHGDDLTVRPHHLDERAVLGGAALPLHDEPHTRHGSTLIEPEDAEAHPQREGRSPGVISVGRGHQHVTGLSR
jgi:hypothetical protein